MFSRAVRWPARAGAPRRRAGASSSADAVALQHLGEVGADAVEVDVVGRRPRPSASSSAGSSEDERLRRRPRCRRPPPRRRARHRRRRRRRRAPSSSPRGPPQRLPARDRRPRRPGSRRRCPAAAPRSPRALGRTGCTASRRRLRRRAGTSSARCDVDERPSITSARRRPRGRPRSGARGRPQVRRGCPRPRTRRARAGQRRALGEVAPRLGDDHLGQQRVVARRCRLARRSRRCRPARRGRPADRSAQRPPPGRPPVGQRASRRSPAPGRRIPGARRRRASRGGSVAPAGERSCELTRSRPVTSSVTVCSTCSRGWPR